MYAAGFLTMALIHLLVVAIVAIKLLTSALPKAHANPENLQARDDIATAGVGAVYALAYPLGGHFSIAHVVSNALLSPYLIH